jgi:hypothetical protein
VKKWRENERERGMVYERGYGRIRSLKERRRESERERGMVYERGYGRIRSEKERRRERELVSEKSVMS